METADIFVTTTGNKDIIMAGDMAKMKNNAIVGNIGHFDNEIDMAGLLGWPGIKRQNIKPQARDLLFVRDHADPDSTRPRLNRQTPSLCR